MVDILSGGYPCQPFSSAGKRLGADDERHLWPFIRDGIQRMAPRVCFFENVEGHISLGLSTVISDLEEMGYKVSFGIFSAAECGAPHQRKRVFVLAHRDGERGQLSDWGRVTAEQMPVCNGTQGRDVWPSRPGKLANNGSKGLQGGQRIWATGAEGTSSGHASQCSFDLWPSRPGQPQYAWEPPRVVADAKGSGWADQRKSKNMGDSEDAKTNGGHKFTQTSSDCGGTGKLQNKAVAHSECRGGKEPELLDANLPTKPSECDPEGMGYAEQQHECREIGINELQSWEGRIWPCGQSSAETDWQQRQTQPTLGGDADGPPDWLDNAELYESCDNRTDELRLLGNGVMPATAALAFNLLLQQARAQTTVPLPRDASAARGCPARADTYPAIRKE